MARQQITLSTWLLRHGNQLRLLAGFTPATMAVLQNLVSHVPAEVYPSVETIGEETGLGRRAVFSAIAALERTAWDGVALLSTRWTGRRTPTRSFPGLELIRAEMTTMQARERAGWLENDAARIGCTTMHPSAGVESAQPCTPGVHELDHPRDQEGLANRSSVCRSATDALSNSNLPTEKRKAAEDAQAFAPISPPRKRSDQEGRARVVVPRSERGWSP